MNVEWNKTIYHLGDTLKHVSTIQQLFVKLLENSKTNDDNILNIFKFNGSFDVHNLLLQSKSFKTIHQNTNFFIHDIKSTAIRIMTHDATKLNGDEYEGYKNVVYMLNGMEYGTPEHKQTVALLDEPFKYHVRDNSHHIEHYPNGLLDFNIVDLIEMILDWCSACICRGFKFKLSSITHNQKKMGFDDGLHKIIETIVRIVLSEDQIEDDLLPSKSVKKALVIAGFPGVGKSYCTETLSDKYIILDSDSSNFSWIKDSEGNNTTERNPDFPNNYINHIKDNIDTADVIFVSTHENVIFALEDAGIQFSLVYPNNDEFTLDILLKRYKERCNSPDFINFIKNNFYEFIATLDSYKFINILYKYKLHGDLYLDEELINKFLK